MSDRFAITGLGLITPLGRSAWSTWAALLAGKRITDRVARLFEHWLWDDDLQSFTSAIGSIASAQHTQIDPAVRVAEIAALEALDMASLSDSQERIPMIYAASKGAAQMMCKAAQYPESQEAAASIVEGPLPYVSNRLAQRLPVEPISHVIAACTSSMIGLHRARQCLLSGEADRVLVVTSEEALVEPFVSSYKKLGVLAKPNAQEYYCNPLNQDRHGFVLSSCGAAMLIEREPSSTPIAYLEDSGAACETSHILQSDPQRPALRQLAARLLSSEIDLLHPHATGTLDNDESEMAAYEGYLSPETDVYACKGALGHAMGSAGLCSAILACMAAKTQKRPPMRWLKSPIESSFNLSVLPKHQAINRQACFAAGFGGHCAGVVIGR